MLHPAEKSGAAAETQASVVGSYKTLCPVWRERVLFVVINGF